MFSQGLDICETNKFEKKREKNVFIVLPTSNKIFNDEPIGFALIPRYKKTATDLIVQSFLPRENSFPTTMQVNRYITEYRNSRIPERGQLFGQQSLPSSSRRLLYVIRQVAALLLVPVNCFANGRDTARGNGELWASAVGAHSK